MSHHDGGTIRLRQRLHVTSITWSSRESSPKSGKRVPVGFEIAYDPAEVGASRTYTVQASIEESARLRFINDRRHAVITRGAPMHVDMMLRAVGGPAPV
jgi:uncharacterized lipoprotein YbaY